MKIKVQILTENMDILPDKTEMSVLTAKSDIPLKCVINTTAQGVVVANRGLHPTKFTKPLLYKTKNLLTLFIKYYFFLHILFL